MSKFLDTCTVLENFDDLKDCIICSKTIEELENIKTSAYKSEDIKYKARQAVKAITRDKPTIVVINQEDYDTLNRKNLEITNDNLIIACAERVYLNKREYLGENDKLEFVTYDYLCGLIANTYFHIPVEMLEEHQSDDLYKGYKIVLSSDEELAKIYSKENCDNIFDCLINEYIIINDNEGNFCDVLKWTGDNYKNVYNKNFKSRQLGVLKPLDIQQRMAFDSIIENDITVLTGKAGTGKTTIPLAYIMQALESGKYKKCYIVYSYETLKNQKTLGYVKGDDLTKKLYSSSLGGILSSKFGDMSEVERLIMSGQLDIVPTANLRGVEFGEDSIIICTESQNLDTYALKTLIQRCKTGAKLILEGDILEQCDTSRSVGLFKMIDIFKGHKCFGCIKLKNNYRSEISELADLL